MEIKYSDDVKLVVNITEQMKQDFRKCAAAAQVKGGTGGDCDTCSLNVEIEGGTSLCEVPIVIEELEE